MQAYFPCSLYVYAEGCGGLPRETTGVGVAPCSESQGVCSVTSVLVLRVARHDDSHPVLLPSFRPPVRDCSFSKTGCSLLAISTNGQKTRRRRMTKKKKRPMSLLNFRRRSLPSSRSVRILRRKSAYVTPRHWWHTSTSTRCYHWHTRSIRRYVVFPACAPPRSWSNLRRAPVMLVLCRMAGGSI